MNEEVMLSLSALYLSLLELDSSTSFRIKPHEYLVEYMLGNSSEELLNETNYGTEWTFGSSVEEDTINYCMVVVGNHEELCFDAEEENDKFFIENFVNESTVEPAMLTELLRTQQGSLNAQQLKAVSHLIYQMGSIYGYSKMYLGQPITSESDGIVLIFQDELDKAGLQIVINSTMDILD